MTQKIYFTRRPNVYNLSETVITSLLLLLNLMIVEASAIFPDAGQLLSSPASVDNINELDGEIQKYAFQSFKRFGTGKTYEVTLPSNLTGLKVEAVRLRSGSLRRHGFSFNEFLIPIGASVDSPSPVRVLLIYREFTGFKVYNPRGYTLVAPVLGIKIYSAANLSITDALPELHLTSLQTPITVRIPLLSMAPVTTPFCASFDSSGVLMVSNLTLHPNVCSFTHLGDFSLAIPASAPAPSSSPGTSETESKSRRNAWKIALVSAVGAFALLAIAIVVALVVKSIKKKRIAKMETESERGEALQTTAIGNHSRTPTAGIMRTRPTLDRGFVLE